MEQPKSFNNWSHGMTNEPWPTDDELEAAAVSEAIRTLKRGKT